MLSTVFSIVAIVFSVISLVLCTVSLMRSNVRWSNSKLRAEFNQLQMEFVSQSDLYESLKSSHMKLRSRIAMREKRERDRLEQPEEVDDGQEQLPLDGPSGATGKDELRRRAKAQGLM